MNKYIFSYTKYLFYFVFVCALSGCSQSPQTFREINNPHVAVHISDLFTLSEKHISMDGPSKYQDYSILETDPPEIIWITGMEQEILDEHENAYPSNENYCHGNLFLNYNSDKEWGKRSANFGRSSHHNRWLFGLFQGQQEYLFPEGYGIAVHTKEPLRIGSMLINYKEGIEPLKMKVRSNIYYHRQKELKTQIKPLFIKQLILTIPGEIHSEHHHGHSSGQRKGSGHDLLYVPYEIMTFKTPDGQQHSGHWLVPPGEHTYKKKMPKGLGLEFDTTAHYIAAHLHPYGQSVTLVDLTSNTVVFKSVATPSDTNPRVFDMASFSSKKGVPIYKDHEYELVAEVNNTTDEQIDMMSNMYLFLEDKHFKLSDIKLPEK